jgi:phosphoadenosine phosphosulfate reductase
MFTNEEQLKYKILYKRMTAKIDKALRVINNMLTVAPHSYVAVSWGKDSSVLLDLCIKVNPEIEIIWVDRGEGGDVPEVYELVKYYQNKGYNIRQLRTPLSILDLHRQYSLNELETNGAISKNLKTTFGLIEHEYDGFFWGIRAEESKGRRRLAMSKKEIFQRKSGLFTCEPLIWWNAAEIWAYIYHNNVTYNPFYDKVSMKPFDREQIRYSNYAGLVGLGHGRIWPIKKFYRELYDKIVEIQPDIRSYV